MVNIAISKKQVQAAPDADAAPQQANNLPSLCGVEINRSELLREMRYNARSSRSSPEQSQNQSTETPIRHGRSPITEDPRVVQLDRVINQFGLEEVRGANDLLRGANSNLESTRREIEKSGVFAWASGTLRGLRESEAADKQLVDIRKEHLERIEKAHEAAKQQLKAAMNLEAEGRRLEQQGDLKGAQERYNRAQQSFEGIARTLGEASEERVNTRDVIKKLQSANGTIDNGVTILNRTETGLRIARDTTVILGASVATGGVAGIATAAGYGAVATGTLAVIAGTGAGTVIGAAGNYTEAAGHIARGNMSSSQALDRANTQTVQDLQTSAISSIAAVSGTGAAAGTTARLGNGIAARATAGAAAGATSATVSTGLNTSIAYTQAVQDFNAQYQQLPANQREQAYTQFMQERGLSTDQIAWNSAITITTGAFSGGIGGHSSAVKEAVKSGRQAVLLEGREIAATAAVGLGMSYVRDGTISEQSVLQELQGAAVGFAQGRMTTQDPIAAVNNPTLRLAVRRMMNDSDHPMDLTRNLANPELRQQVSDHLIQLGVVKGLTKEEFSAAVAANREKMKALFPQDDSSLNVNPDTGVKRPLELREALLARKPELFSIGDSPTLTPTQEVLLKVHADHIRTKALPQLHDTLTEIAATLPEGRYAQVSSRAKSDDGLQEKVFRMQAGNNGRDLRPEYRLADVPDAAGGRIVVENIGDLPKIMAEIERKFEGKISEKDNFYLSPKKSERPYRVITYTVECAGVPCEVQVMTLASNISSDIDHNTVYKQLVGLNEAQRNNVTEWWRGVTAQELNTAPN